MLLATTTDDSDERALHVQLTLQLKIQTEIQIQIHMRMQMQMQMHWPLDYRYVCECVCEFRARGPYNIKIERTMPITIMPLIMWDNKTKRAPVIQTVAIERMCHQIAVGCVLTETQLNSTEWQRAASSERRRQRQRQQQQQRFACRAPPIRSSDSGYGRRSSQNREAKQLNE